MSAHVANDGFITPEVRRLAHSAFGNDGMVYAVSFARLAGSQIRRFDWLVVAHRANMFRVSEMILDAVSEAVLIADRDGLEGEALVLAAWKATTAEYWRLYGRRTRDGERYRMVMDRPITPDLDDDDVPYRRRDPVAAPLFDPDTAPETLSYDRLTDRHMEVLHARAEGFNWPQVAAIVGLSPRSSASKPLYARSVSRLIDGNPALVVRFGLVRCPAVRQHYRGCVCGGVKWLYADGERIV